MRAVFFDLDGTLVGLPDDFGGLFEAAMADRGVSAGIEHAECYTEAFFEHLGDCASEPYRMAMADLREAYDLDPSAEALAETYIEHEADATDLLPGAREGLDRLDADPDTALGVLTNGGARGQRRKLAHHGVADYFDAVVVSSEVGAGKPDPAIFAAAEDALPADEYVFVADDVERDVLPAQRAGFTGVYVGTDEGEDEEDRAGATDRADFAVRSLAAVPDLLR